MKIVEHGAVPTHHGTDGTYDLVIHKQGEKIHLTEEQAYQLCYDILKHLNEEGSMSED